MTTNQERFGKTMFDNQSLLNGERWLVHESGDKSIATDEWDVVIDFSGYIEGENRISLTKYLYENRSWLVREAASRIDSLGSVLCDESNRTVIEILEVARGESFWYVTGAFEKCIVRNPKLGLYLKCVALESLIERYRPKYIDAHGLCGLSMSALSEISSQLDIVVNGVKNQEIKRIARLSLHLRAMARFLTIAITSLFMLLCRRWPEYDKSNAGYLFIAYSDDLRAGDSDKFEPVYWQGLQNIVMESKEPVNWCHLYDSSAGKSELSVCRQMQDVESVAGSPNRIYLLEQALSLRHVLTGIMLYIRLQKKFSLVEQILNSYQSDNRINPWPFLNDAWERSVRGGTAASLAIQWVLLEQLAKDAPNDTRAFYLCEGMPWERLLLMFWRKYKKGKICGYQHATVKSYDLRIASYSTEELVLKPDAILYNGPAAGRVLKSLGIDDSLLKPVEALRFGYLEHLKKSEDIKSNNDQTIVVLLEGIEENDIFIMDLVREALLSNTLSEEICFLVKPHPSGRVEVAKLLADIETSRWRVSDESIHTVLSSAQLVCTSINSSAAVEVQTLRIPMLLVWNSSEMIRTPLDLDDWSCIITNPEAFKEALQRTNSVVGESDDEQVFFLDDSLPRWRKILNAA